jgi:Uncharacterized conserved protein
MRLSQPRIPPVTDEGATDEQQALLAPLHYGDVIPNLYRTLVNHPPAMRAFTGWGDHILRGGNTLPARERELLVIRIGWLCRAGYEWVAHVDIGREAGLEEDEINRIDVGSTADGWNADDRALLAAAEELHADHFVSDATWEALNARWTRQQCMDVIFTVSHYMQVCMVLNTFGIQLDRDRTLPDKARRAWNL